MFCSQGSGPVSTTAVAGWQREQAYGHPLKQIMPRWKRLQNTHPLMVGRGMVLRTPRVFSPGRRRRRWIGRGFGTWSPSRLLAPARRPGIAVPVGVYVGSYAGVVTSRVGVVRRLCKEAGRLSPMYRPHVSSSRRRVNETGMVEPGALMSRAVVEGCWR